MSAGPTPAPDSPAPGDGRFVGQHPPVPVGPPPDVPDEGSDELEGSAEPEREPSPALAAGPTPTHHLPTWPITDGDTAPPTAPPFPLPRSFADEVTDPRGVVPPTEPAADGLAVAPPSFAGYEEEDDDEAPTVIARAPLIGATPAPVERATSHDRTEPGSATLAAADRPPTARSTPTGPTPPTRPASSRPPLSAPPATDPTSRVVVAVGIAALLVVIAAGVVLRGLGVW